MGEIIRDLSLNRPERGRKRLFAKEPMNKKFIGKSKYQEISSQYRWIGEASFNGEIFQALGPFPQLMLFSDWHTGLCAPRAS